jgi:hypothetical protein
MKIIISEAQHKRLFEEEQQVLHIHDIKVFGGWNNLKRYLELKGNPPYRIGGDLDLSFTSTRTLGNLQSVGGYLDLSNTDIQYLWKLKSVGGSLFLSDTSVTGLGFFGDLEQIGGNLHLKNTPISQDYTEKEIRDVINVVGNIYL